MNNRFYIPGSNGTVAEYVRDGDTVHRRIHNPHAATVMKVNQGLRQTPGAVRSTSFGKLELDIPVDHLHAIDKWFPGIANPAHPDHKFQLRKFMASPLADVYRVQERKRGVHRGTHIQT